MVLLEEPHISKEDERADACHDSDDVYNGEDCHDGRREENMMMTMMMGMMISAGKKIR